MRDTSTRVDLKARLLDEITKKMGFDREEKKSGATLEYPPKWFGGREKHHRRLRTTDSGAGRKLDVAH